MDWLIAGVLVASFAYSLYLRSKLAGKSTSLTIQGPTASEGVAISAVFGTKQIPNPNCCWYGNQRDENADGTHYYSLDAQIVLCHGKIDKLIDVVTNSKRTMWRTGNASTNKTDPIDVDGTSFHAGQIGEHPDSSKFYMTATVHMGAVNNSTVDAGIADELALAMGMEVGPKYYGVAWLFAKCSLGTSPMLSPIEAIVQRIHTRKGGEVQWYDAKAEISTGRAVGDLWKYKLQAADDNTDWSGISLDDSAWLQAAGPISNGPACAVLKSYNDYPLPLIKTQLPIDGTQILDGGTFYYGNKYSGGKVQAGCKLWLRWDLGAMPAINMFAQLWHDDSAKLFFNGTEVTVKPTVVDAIPNNAHFNSTAAIPASLVNPTGPNVIALRVLDSYASVFGSFANGAKLGSSQLLFAGLQIGNDTSVPGKLVDMNPAHIIFEVLTDPLWGLGYNDNDLDDTAFRAAADTLYAENFGMSLEWSQQSTIEDFLSTILQHISGVLYIDHETGLFVLKLIRDDYDIEDLLTLGEATIVRVEDVKRKLPGELVNSVTVTYSATPRGDQGSITIFDEGLLQIQGGVVSSKIDYPGVTNSLIAGNLALRDLRALSSPLLSATVHAARHAAALNIGDPFVLNWPDLQINNVVMRVATIDVGDGVNNTVKLTCVEDVFAYPNQRVTGTNSPIAVPAGPTTIRTSKQDTYHTCKIVDARNKGYCECAFHDAGWSEGTLFGDWEEISPGVMQKLTAGRLYDWQFDGVDPDPYNTTGVSPLIGARVFALEAAGALNGGDKRYSGAYIVDDVGAHLINIGTPQQQVVNTYARMHRDPDFSQSSQFTAQATFTMRNGTVYGGHAIQLATLAPVLGVTELDWTDEGEAFVFSDAYALLKTSELAGRSIPIDVLNTSATGSDGTHDFPFAFPTQAGTPGARAILAGRWQFLAEACWLDPDAQGDPGSITTLGYKAYRSRGNTGEVLFEVLSAQITATTPQAITPIDYDGPQYLLDPTDLIVLIPTIHTDSVTPVTLWLRYNSPDLVTGVKMPMASGDVVIVDSNTAPIVVPAGSMSLDGPSKYTVLGTLGNHTTAVGLPHGSTMGASMLVQVPRASLNGVMVVRPIWAPSSNASGVAVRWNIVVSVVGIGAISSAGTSTPSTSDAATFTADVPIVETGVVVSAAAKDAWLRIGVQRLGADAGDTYTGQANLLGLQIDY